MGSAFVGGEPEGRCAACLLSRAPRGNRVSVRVPVSGEPKNEAAASREDATKKNRRHETQREQMEERGTRSSHYLAKPVKRTRLNGEAARASAAARIRRQKQWNPSVARNQREQMAAHGWKNRGCQP
jgi:hypothetical protein